MSKDDLNFGSLDMLFNTLQGREVIEVLFSTLKNTNDIFSAIYAARKKAENNNISGILQVYGALDLLKLIALVNPELFKSIQKFIMDLPVLSKQKPNRR